MIIFTTSLVGLPLCLTVWAAESLLFLTAIRWAFAGLAASRHTRLVDALSAITDRLPQHITQWLAAYRGRPTPPWVGWTVVIVGLVLVRNSAISLLMHLCC